jgi:anti-sigma B factor antagonist
MKNPIPAFRTRLERPSDDVAVVAIEGDVDIYSAPQFKDALTCGIEACAHIVVDLTGATFLDSTALGVLVNGAKRARKGALSVVCSDPALLRIFEIVGLQSVFVMYGTLREALKAISVGDVAVGDAAQ